MIVYATPRRDVDISDFTDITTVTVMSVEWAGSQLAVNFAADLDAATVARVIRRIESRNANEETLRGQAEQALLTNRTFLDIATPTNAQTLAQVKALTRQSNGVIRMLLGKLDGTD